VTDSAHRFPTYAAPREIAPTYCDRGGRFEPDTVARHDGGLVADAVKFHLGGGKTLEELKA
jgi:hypothetical protein